MPGNVSLYSFSFKRGIPGDAELLFDVRFLKNPFYEPTLSHLTGLDKAAGDYIETDKGFAAFFSKLTALLDTALPRYFDEDRRRVTIAIGCTGGIHRSVHVTQQLADFLRQEGYEVTVCHRDLSPHKPA